MNISLRIVEVIMVASAKSGCAQLPSNPPFDFGGQDEKGGP